MGRDRAVAHVHLTFAQVGELGVRTGAPRVVLLTALDSALVKCCDGLLLL